LQRTRPFQEKFPPEFLIISPDNPYAKQLAIVSSVMSDVPNQGPADVRRPRKHLRTGSSGSHRIGRSVGTPPIELAGRMDAPL
jgi:hypothetical protein